MTRRTSFASLEGTISLHQAQRGDVSILLARLRSGVDLLPEERDFLADLIEGKRQRPQNRAGSLEARLRQEAMVEEVLILRLLNPAAKGIVPWAAARHGVSASYLYRTMRELEAAASDYEAVQGRAEKWAARIKDFEKSMEDRKHRIVKRWEARRLVREA